MVFTADIIEQVWKKAISGEGYKEVDFRKDPCGAWIARIQYNNESSNYGWKIDYITPLSKGGKDILSNLRPIHWRNYSSRARKKIKCKFISDGKKNIIGTPSKSMK